MGKESQPHHGGTRRPKAVAPLLRSPSAASHPSLSRLETTKQVLWSDPTAVIFKCNLSTFTVHLPLDFSGDTEVHLPRHFPLQLETIKLPEHRVALELLTQAHHFSPANEPNEPITCSDGPVRS